MLCLLCACRLVCTVIWFPFQFPISIMPSDLRARPSRSPALARARAPQTIWNNYEFIVWRFVCGAVLTSSSWLTGNRVWYRFPSILRLSKLADIRYAHVAIYKISIWWQNQAHGAYRMHFVAVHNVSLLCGAGGAACIYSTHGDRQSGGLVTQHLLSTRKSGVQKASTPRNMPLLNVSVKM